MTPDRFIIDTNVLVAALITRDRTSPTARILDKMLNGTLVFLISPDLLAEYRNVLLRPRLRSAHKLSEAQIDTLPPSRAWSACSVARVRCHQCQSSGTLRIAAARSAVSCSCGTSGLACGGMSLYSRATCRNSWPLRSAFTALLAFCCRPCT